MSDWYSAMRNTWNPPVIPTTSAPTTPDRDLIKSLEHRVLEFERGVRYETGLGDINPLVLVIAELKMQIDQLKARIERLETAKQ
jgi:hypothetical protein